MSAPVVVAYRIVPPKNRTAEFSGSWRIPEAFTRLAVPGMKHATRRQTWQCPARYADAVIAELEKRHGADIHQVLW
jgi:hypothetical protein